VSAPGDVRAGELDRVQGATLVRVAREAIAARLRGASVALPEAAGALAQRRGAFVTLRRRDDGELRGCVGRMQSDRPLLETVAEMAVAAATADGRFEPVTAAELDRLAIEVSALGPLRPTRPEDVEVGRHGLLVSRGGRRGVLLPQVPVEHGWDRETFLAKTCWKAGLPESAYRDPGTELLAFTATVFGEGEAAER
jgi:AmmeMemoRadiSam system protein A